MPSTDARRKDGADAKLRAAVAFVALQQAQERLAEHRTSLDRTRASMRERRRVAIAMSARRGE
jgi:hypothetical protein